MVTDCGEEPRRGSASSSSFGRSFAVRCLHLGDAQKRSVEAIVELDCTSASAARPGSEESASSCHVRPLQLHVRYTQFSLWPLALWLNAQHHFARAAGPEKAERTRERAPTFLAVGLGGGMFVHLWRALVPRVRVVAAEIDRSVLEAAAHAMGLGVRAAEGAVPVAAAFGSDGKVHRRLEETGLLVALGDGRELLRRAPPGAFDLVIVDLALGGFLEPEDLRALYRVLSSPGVMAQNVFGYGEPEKMQELFRRFVDFEVAGGGGGFDEVQLFPTSRNNAMPVALKGSWAAVPAVERCCAPGRGGASTLPVSERGMRPDAVAGMLGERFGMPCDLGRLFRSLPFAASARGRSLDGDGAPAFSRMRYDALVEQWVDPEAPGPPPAVLRPHPTR